MSSVCRRAIASGLVQGVGFRFHTVDRARALGLVGWVRNLPDGRVEVLAQGDEAQVAELVRWLQEGPRAAHVERVETFDEPCGDYATFEVRRGSFSAP